MQNSFTVLMNRLQEYKGYIPEAVFVRRGGIPIERVSDAASAVDLRSARYLSDTDRMDSRITAESVVSDGSSLQSPLGSPRVQSALSPRVQSALGPQVPQPQAENNTGTDGEQRPISRTARRTHLKDYARTVSRLTLLGRMLKAGRTVAGSGDVASADGLEAGVGAKLTRKSAAILVTHAYAGLQVPRAPAYRAASSNPLHDSLPIHNTPTHTHTLHLLRGGVLGMGAVVRWWRLHIWNSSAPQGSPPAGQTTGLMVSSSGRTVGPLNLAV